MEIMYLPTGELKPYPKNAKRHPPEQVEHIANSIRAFGFRQPIVIDADNVVVIGHGRLMAAKKLGMDSVPCIRADDLTEAQIAALRLADNKTNESEWDFSELEAELDGLDFDMGQFGFNDMLGGANPIPDNLDSDEEDGEKKLSAKLTFANYTAYSAHEDELKRIAAEMGAEFAVTHV